MLNKKLKFDLRNNQGFFKKCKKLQCGGALLYYLPNSSNLQTIVLVAKKNAAKSTQRNLVKRTVYKAIEELLPEIKDWQLSVVIVIVNPQQILAEKNLKKNFFLCFQHLRKK